MKDGASVATRSSAASPGRVALAGRSVASTPRTRTTGRGGEAPRVGGLGAVACAGCRPCRSRSEQEVGARAMVAAASREGVPPAPKRRCRVTIVRRRWSLDRRRPSPARRGEGDAGVVADAVAVRGERRQQRPVARERRPPFAAREVESVGPSGLDGTGRRRPRSGDELSLVVAVGHRPSGKRPFQSGRYSGAARGGRASRAAVPLRSRA